MKNNPQEQRDDKAKAFVKQTSTRRTQYHAK
jgi:hypothetical protein